MALLVAAHPVWNVPPFINTARELARQNYAVVVIGYRSDALPRRERIASGVWIVRLSLLSRAIRWTGLRKLLALLEFLLRSRAAVHRLQPDVLITFNDPASILQRFTGAARSRKRISWLLEYPELERFNAAQRLLFRFSASCWNHADTIVVPTKERLALHLALRPECGRRRTLVIHNAPPKVPPPEAEPSARTRDAVRWLRSHEPETLRVVYSGAIGNRYGLDSLIRAAGSFPRGIAVLLLGPKHALAESEVTAALRGAAFPDNVRWIDEIPYRELSQVLASSDAGFVTYRGDTLNTRFSAPGKLYEYLRTGLSILSDDECCISAEASAAGCGVFFPKPITEAGIRTALETMLQSQDRREAMKTSARNLFETRLNLEKQMEPLLADLSESLRREKTGSRDKSEPLPVPVLRTQEE